ncbi:unannotated protein [freshwater metagenome]|uniref:Unannotated protein n=1 Tax=freshwater metagenome TaxID=449393 RepID=A0A6J7UNI2_9ZZZZ
MAQHLVVETHHQDLSHDPPIIHQVHTNTRWCGDTWPHYLTARPASRMKLHLLPIVNLKSAEALPPGGQVAVQRVRQVLTQVVNESVLFALRYLRQRLWHQYQGCSPRATAHCQSHYSLHDVRSRRNVTKKIASLHRVRPKTHNRRHIRPQTMQPQQVGGYCSRAKSNQEIIKSPGQTICL